MFSLRKIKINNRNSGFTVIELMVVVALMAILAGAMIINLNGQRTKRDVKIAQNELVTNIRKVQAYTLSSRALTGGVAAQYYLLKFDLNNPTQYKIQALYDTSSSPKLADVETISLPPNIQIATTTSYIYSINIKRSLNPSVQPLYTGCGLAAFAAPYAKVIFNDGCSITSTSSLPTLNLNDDYYSKIINFQNNVACDSSNGSPPNPTGCSASTDTVMTITLTDNKKTISKYVYINGITGAVTFSQ